MVLSGRALSCSLANLRYGKSSSMQLKFADYIYVLFSCIAGAWQAWCVGFGRDSILLPVVMSLPFTLASYLHASFFSTSSTFVRRPDWRRILVLWAGMPLSLVVFFLTVAAETGIMYLFGFGMVDLPLYNLRLMIGEGAASLAWAVCLLAWSRRPGLGLSRNHLLATFATLFAGVLFAHGLTYLVLRTFHRDFYGYLESTVATVLSALVLVFLKRKPEEDVSAAFLGPD